MDKKKSLIIVGAIILVIVIGIVIFLSIQNSNKDYETAMNLEYNYYKVNNKGKYGVLNKNGDLIVDISYDDIIIPNPSKAVFICQYNYDNTTGNADYIVLNDKSEQIFKQFELVEAIPVTGIIDRSVPYEKLALRYKENNMYGLLSIDGNKLTDPIYEEIASVPYKEGVFLVKENEKYGVINNKGTELIKAEYDNIVGDGYYNDEEGYKASCFIVTKGEYMGYISEFGDTILENEYDSIHRITDLPERYIIAKRNGQFGLLNNTKIIIGFNYQLLDYDKSSNLIVVKRNKNYGVINIEGNKVLPLEYNDINIEGIYIVATKNGAIEKYTLDGQAVTNDLYSSIQKTNGEYYISIDKNYNYGIVDKDMNVIIPNKYEYMDYISDNLIIVRNSSGKYGVIDIKEQNKVSFDYDVMHTIKGTNIIEAMILSTKTLHLYNSDATRIYNEKNASIYEHDNYIEVSTDTSVSYFSNDAKELSNAEVYPNNTLLSYNENGKWGFKNREGEVVIQAIYDKVTELNANGFAGIMSDGKWGIINQTGEIISTPIYELPDNITSPDFLGKNYMGGLCYVALEG